MGVEAPIGGTGRVRRAPRVSALGVDVRYCMSSSTQWHAAKLFDLSLGGALASLGLHDDERGALSVGTRLALILERKSDSLRTELHAEIVRLVGNDGRAALRFVELSAAATGALTQLLNEALGVDESVDEDAPTSRNEVVRTDEPSINGKPLTSLRLHETSLYELLHVDDSCTNAVLEEKCESLIALVDGELRGAVGKRESRLRVLHNSLLRMRPLWSDPVKRARYDLRWGYFRVDERLAAAEDGTGVHAHVLAAIWFDLYPDMVREAERVMTRARSDGLVPCLKKAIEYDPFNRRRRQRLHLIENPPEPDAEGPAMPPPGAPQIVKGSLVDLPLRTLLRSVAEDDEDAEIVVRVDGKAVGVLGLVRGDLVTAMCGDHRGVDAVRMLNAIPEGTFTCRYAAPKPHLRHMRQAALAVLEDALETPLTLSTRAITKLQSKALDEKTLIGPAPQPPATSTTTQPRR